VEMRYVMPELLCQFYTEVQPHVNIQITRRRNVPPFPVPRATSQSQFPISVSPQPVSRYMCLFWGFGCRPLRVRILPTVYHRHCTTSG
jgi:hypothetical protein